MPVAHCVEHAEVWLCLEGSSPSWLPLPHLHLEPSGCVFSPPFPSLPSPPRATHSAKNILEDISNMFDDLADQLDAMLD